MPQDRATGGNGSFLKTRQNERWPVAGRPQPADKTTAATLKYHIRLSDGKTKTSEYIFMTSLSFSCFVPGQQIIG
jgi:hypothetical protein